MVNKMIENVNILVFDNNKNTGFEIRNGHINMEREEIEKILKELGFEKTIDGKWIHKKLFDEKLIYVEITF